MDYVILNSGWLENQIKATQKEVKDWPKRFREQAEGPTKSGGSTSAGPSLHDTPAERPQEG